MDKGTLNLYTIPEDKLQEKKLIGSGGFGEVYKAWHKDWGHLVALKKLNTKHVQNGQEQLLLEAKKMLCALSIDHVLRMYGLCRCSDASFGLVMEYMENGSLARLQALVKPLPWALKFRVLHEINLGMNRLHDLCPPLLHLDLKPQNVLLNKDLHIKISDFGLSRFKRGITLPQDVPPADGTLEFMAPELLDDVNCCPTKASDVYSYAILIWSVLKGEEPYSNAMSSVIKLHVPRGQRPSLEFLQDLYNHVERLEDIKSLMVKCWHQEPSERPSFKDCIQTTREIFKAHEHQEGKAVCDVWDALKKMETSLEQERWEVPSSTTLSSSPTSGLLANFKTMTLEQPPSLMNEAVPLSDPSSRTPQGFNSTGLPPPTAGAQGTRKKITDVTPQPPINGTGYPKTPVSSADPYMQGPYASTPSSQTTPARPGSQTRITGTVSYLQIGDNNKMDIRHTRRKTKTKK
ncbi:receptor-interacting serine/threonine-protein kinase 3 [Microcaecilia unicolor]|uniref:Receptor-interacting serine/threonine-protein kinase 3 n=1 Tax=Microcaecilia unicolor TaxID=1415580 RepID=A0A6P7WTT1_9AMPH|nr:receptor-interacting serine/threonine-protein kinase 3 [Microcaecilia unicolor]